MRLQVLGCSGGIAAGLSTTAFRIDEDILVDGGTGVGHLTIAEMRAIRHVFVSHAHFDHTVGIPLLVDTAFECLAGDPVTIHGRPETIHALRAHLFNDVVWPDFTLLPDPDHGVVRFAEHEPGERVEIAGRVLESVDVFHTIPAVGYHCRSDTGSFCFSGDTGPNDGLWQFLNAREPVDALIVETGFPNASAELAAQTRHYCPQTLAADLRKLDHRPRILITHLKPGCEDEIMQELAAALPDHDLHCLQSGESFEL